MKRRGISPDVVEQVLRNPGQIVEGYGNKKAYQSIIDFENDKSYLVRVIVDTLTDPLMVVTVYRTSKIDKYWKR